MMEIRSKRKKLSLILNIVESFSMLILLRSSSNFSKNTILLKNLPILTVTFL